LKSKHHDLGIGRGSNFGILRGYNLKSYLKDPTLDLLKINIDEDFILPLKTSIWK